MSQMHMGNNMPPVVSPASANSMPNMMPNMMPTAVSPAAMGPNAMPHINVFENKTENIYVFPYGKHGHHHGGHHHGMNDWAFVLVLFVLLVIVLRSVGTFFGGKC